MECNGTVWIWQLDGKGRMKIKVKFVSAEKEGWDYLKGTCTIDAKPTIKLSELSEIIQEEYRLQCD